MKLAPSHGPRLLTIVHGPGQVRPQPGDVTGFSCPLPVGLISDTSDHLVQLSAGDGVFEGAMQPSCPTASSGAVFKIPDLLPELAEVRGARLSSALVFPPVAAPLKAAASSASVSRSSAPAAGQSRCLTANISSSPRRSWPVPVRCAHFFSPGRNRAAASCPSARPVSRSCA